MSGAPVSFDRVIPEETQGPMPVEAPTTLASGSMDSFQHVEAVLKDDNVSTGTLDSQGWEMVTEMVEDTDNAATHFLQGKHVIDLEGPAPNLQDSIDTMMATMEKMKLGSTADGVEAPSRPEGVASAAAVPSADAAPMDDSVLEQTTHKWKVFGRGTSSPTFILAEVPFSMEAVTKDIKLMVDKLSTEEIYDLFVKFCDSESIPAVSFGRVVKAYVAMKAQKVHDEVMKQPHVAGRSRPGVGSDSLRENTQPEPIATHQCPECFTDWATQWDPTKEKMCVCGIKKTKHLVNIWLLFMTGNGITWVRDGKSEADAASASGDGSSKSDKDFKLRHAVDIGMLAEAPLCPADHAETSLSDFVLSKDRLQLRTEVLHRVVDAETSPSEAPSRPQNSKDCKKDQAALVFHPDAAAAILAGKLTGADVPPEEAFHPKRPEAEMLKVVQDNADILHDMQSGAMSVEDPQGAEALRHLDMVKFKEVLKRKFLEGPGSNQSAWEALNRSMVDLDTAKTKNREYEQARRAYKQFLTPIAGNPSIWGEELQQLIEAGFFCPLTGMRKPSPELDQSNAIGEYVKAKQMIAELRQQALAAKLLRCHNASWTCMWPPRSQTSPFPWSQDLLRPRSPFFTMCDGEIRLHTGRWRRYESTDVPTWSKLPQPVWEAAQALERRTHPKWGPQASGVAPILVLLEATFSPMNLRLPMAVLGFVGRRRSRPGPCLHCWGSMAISFPWSSFGMPRKTYLLPWRDTAGDNVVVEHKELKIALWRGRRSRRRLWISWNRCSCRSQPRWRSGVWFGGLLAAKHFISHTPVPVMDLPVADVVDSKEQLRFRAMCDERISFPFEELRPFEEVYAKLEPYVQSSSYVEVKVAWRCNTEQWWWAEVDPAHAGPLYRKLNYSDEAIRAFGLDPDLPVGAPVLGAAAAGAGSSTRTPLLMEYPDQPRPPITVENVNSVMGKDSKKKVGGKEKHIFWAKTECGLVLSSVTPWEIISKEKGVTTGGYMCKHCQGFWKQGRGATRLVQIIGRNKGKKVSLQLIMDEPPEALYNQWIKDRIEYYKRVEPVAPPRDEQLDLGPPVAFQWSWTSGPNDLGVHPEQSGTFQSSVHRQGGW